MRTFCSVFRTPWKNPCTDIRETYGQLLPSQALRHAIFGAKQRLAVFYGDSLNKKRNKKHAIYNSLPYRHTPERAAVIKHAIKLKASPARLAQLLQPW